MAPQEKESVFIALYFPLMYTSVINWLILSIVVNLNFRIRESYDATSHHWPPLYRAFESNYLMAGWPVCGLSVLVEFNQEVGDWAWAEGRAFAGVGETPYSGPLPESLLLQKGQNVDVPCCVIRYKDSQFDLTFMNLPHLQALKMSTLMLALNPGCIFKSDLICVCCDTP